MKAESRTKWHIGEDIVFFDPERSVSPPSMAGRALTLFFVNRGKTVKQQMAQSAAAQIVSIERVVVTDRMITIYSSRIKTIADGRELAHAFIDSLEQVRSARIKAIQRAEKAGARSSKYVNTPQR